MTSFCPVYICLSVSRITENVVDDVNSLKRLRP